VDLTISRLSFESEAIDRGQPVVTGGLEFSVATPEDLIVMKAVAHRPQDLLDICAIVRANPKLEVSRIRTQVRQFAKALDMPKLWTDLAVILKPLTKRKARRSKGSRKKN
jgi:predicted nucleotidyltransferase